MDEQSTDKSIKAEQFYAIEQELLEAQKLAHIGNWRWEFASNTHYWSDQIFSVYGRDPALGPAVYPEVSQYFTPESWVKLSEAVDKCVSDGMPYECDAEVIRPDGEHRWIIARGRAVFDSNRNIVCLRGTVQDITDRKLSEIALQNREKQLRFVLQGSGLGFWDWDIVTGKVDRNEQWASMLGYSYEEIQKTTKQWTDFIYPDDREPAWNSINDVLEGRSNSHHIEYRMLHKNGSIRWILDQANVMERDSNGKPKRMCGTHTDITEHKAVEEEINHIAYHDHLTDLPNRRLFQDRLEHELIKAHRSQSKVALLYIDLDQFKEVNDTLGHDAGDDLLIEAASRIKNCIRESDTLARFGGDEFTIIVSEIHEPSVIEKIAETILDTLHEPFNLGTEQVYVSASIGITIYPDDSESVSTLLKNADQAMYSAKDAGKNCFVYHTPALQYAAQIRLQFSRDLRKALLQKQFEVFYQPIVELKTNTVTKAEALIRWQHPEHGTVNPSVFIPIAEETGVIHDIGDWVFKEAVQMVKTCQSITQSKFQISVNKSPVQFHCRDEVHYHWEDYLAEHHIPENSIVVEITEGLLLDANTLIKDKLRHFRDSGIQVAIDDFGTGYSSLSYLKKFSIDYLKIDQSFTRNLGTEDDDLALCEAIVVMAHKLGLKVIAEGVETEQQLSLLKSIDCDFAQGYLFAQPMPVIAFQAYLREHY